MNVQFFDWDYFHLTALLMKETYFKEALTIFERLHYDPETNTSLVKCEPKTGRTHQIRRHLKMLGKFLFKIVVSSLFKRFHPTILVTQSLQHSHNMKSKVITQAIYRIFCQNLNFLFSRFFWCASGLFLLKNNVIVSKKRDRDPNKNIPNKAKLNLNL